MSECEEQVSALKRELELANMQAKVEIGGGEAEVPGVSIQVPSVSVEVTKEDNWDVVWMITALVLSVYLGIKIIQRIFR